MKEPFKLVQHEIDKIHLSIQEWSNKPFGYAQIIRDIESLLSSREGVEGGEVEKERELKKWINEASIYNKMYENKCSELTRLRAELEQVKVVVPSEEEIQACAVRCAEKDASLTQHEQVFVVAGFYHGAKWMHSQIATAPTGDKPEGNE